jgi:hypothetical protein
MPVSYKAPEDIHNMSQIQKIISLKIQVNEGTPAKSVWLSQNIDQHKDEP